MTHVNIDATDISAPQDLTSLTVGQLQTIARALGIPGSSKLRKGELVESISEIQAGTPAGTDVVAGGFSNIWVAAGGGLAIGAIEGAAARIDGLANYRGALPFLLIAIALIWMRRRKVWDDAR